MKLEKIIRKNNKISPLKEEYWIPLSDLMSGLMMIFMLIAVFYMVKVEKEAQKIKDVALVYNEMRSELYEELKAEFKPDLVKWGAELEPDLTIRFKEPDVLFDTGEDGLKPRFMSILDDFFPRYIKILSSDKYKLSIEEVRIEGHTSSMWRVGTPENTAYFLNMELSQARTRSVLQYVLTMASINGQQDWLKRHLTANGLSSSKLVYNSNGSENVEGSQRVEFRVRTNADERISEILKSVQK